MNYENRRAPCGDVGNAKEVDMILGNGHDGIVVGGCNPCRLLVTPRDRAGLGGSERLHLQGVELAIGQSI